MIKYRLKCNCCSKSFDSWFSSSKEYDKLKKKQYLNCLFCNSKEIKKTLMAPNILGLKYIEREKIKKNQKIKNKILGFQNYIKDNFENVGNDFVYKARYLHYNDKKETKGIYGNATKKQITELHEEGIETQIFPWIDNKNN